MSVYTKLLEARKAIGKVQKDKVMGGTGGGYKYTSINEVSEAVRTALDEVGLAFFPAVEDVVLTDGRYLIKYLFTFVDVETGDTVSMAWAGEALASYVSKSNNLITDDKALGKAHTYAEKYFFLRLFIVSAVDDPDIDDQPSPERPANSNKNMSTVPVTHPPHELEILRLGQEVYGEDWLHGKPTSTLFNTLCFLFGAESTEERVQHLNMDESNRLIAALKKKWDAKQSTPTPDANGDIPF